MLGIARFSATDAILRFFGRFTHGRIEAFFRPLSRCLVGLLTHPVEGFSLDLESRIFNREGPSGRCRQGYVPRRQGRKSHHPLLAALAEAPFILHAWLRSEN
jgi:hypothetical protein